LVFRYWLLWLLSIPLIFLLDSNLTFGSVFRGQVSYHKDKLFEPQLI